MAQPLVRDIEGSRVNQIVRNPIRLKLEVVARYIEPEYACLMALDALTQIDIVITSICWTLKWRPEDVPVYRLSLTEEQQARLTRLMASSVSDHVLMFIGMAGLIAMAEIKLTQPNAKYIFLLFQWQALCATTNMANIFEKEIDYVKQMTIFRAIVTWQAWIRTKTELRRTLLNLVLEENDEREAVVVGMIARVRMILKDFNFKVQIMEAFPMTGSSAVLLPAIVRQAVELRKTVLALKALHKEKYPYIWVFPLEGVDRLHHRNYPDLFFAALSLATKGRDLGAVGRCIISNLSTTIPRATIIERISQRIEIQPQLDEETQKGLEYLGLDPTRLLEQRAPTRQRREIEDEDEKIEVKDEYEEREVTDENEEREVKDEDTPPQKRVEQNSPQEHFY